MSTFSTLSWSNVASIVAMAAAVVITKNNWCLLGLLVPLINTVAFLFISLGTLSPDSLETMPNEKKYNK